MPKNLKNLSAVYGGEYPQWNRRLHSLQVMLFMYKQMQDQGVRLRNRGALRYTYEGWYLQERLMMNTTHLKGDLGTHWYETKLLASD